jgi:hypothetical protein
MKDDFFKLLTYQNLIMINQKLNCDFKSRIILGVTQERYKRDF